MFLTQKAIVRHREAQKRLPISKVFTIQALKDAFAKTLIDTYDLTARYKSLAWKAWRELYYSMYRFQQTTETLI